MGLTLGKCCCFSPPSVFLQLVSNTTASSSSIYFPPRHCNCTYRSYPISREIHSQKIWVLKTAAFLGEEGFIYSVSVKSLEQLSLQYFQLQLGDFIKTEIVT